MDAKLTLKLDKRVIDRAKAYARRHHKSISGMVENYFKNLTGRPIPDEGEMPPLVKSLKGIAKVPANFDLKKEYGKYLEEKYK